MQIAGLNQKILKRLSLNREDLVVKLKSTGLYLLVPVVSFGVSIFTSPLFAKYLTPEEFGYFGYYSSVAIFLTCFYGLLFQTYHMSVFFKYDEAGRKKVLTTLVLFNLLWNIVFFPISCFGVFLYMKYTNSDVPFFPLALLAFGTAALGTYKGFVQANYRLGQKAFLYFALVSGYRVLTTFVSLYFVIYAKMGLYGRMLGALLVEVLFLFISLYDILKDQKIVINKEIIKNAFKVVYPLFPASFLYLPLISYDNIVLERLHQPAEMGLYNIGKQIATFLYTALFPFYQTFEPDIYKNAVQRNIKALKKTGFLLTGIVVVSLIGFWIFSPVLINYMTAGKYNAALKYSNIIAVTSAITIIFSIFDAILNALHETKKSLLINTIAAGLCIVLYTLGAKLYAQVGVAYAAVFTYVCLIGLQVFFVVRKFKREKITNPIVSHENN